MEIDELDAFVLQELHQPTTTNPAESTTPEIISSWLNLDDCDDIYTHSLPPELQELEKHLLHNETDHLAPSLPRVDHHHPVFQNFSGINTQNPTSDTFQSLPIGQSITQQPLPDEHNFLNDLELYFATPTDSQEGNVAHVNESTNMLDMMLTSGEPDKSEPMIINDNPMGKDNVVHPQNDEEKDGKSDEGTKNGDGLIYKNSVAERKRRKRLTQQLIALRALVPNITKMDRQSVLLDALSYLRSVLDETAMLQKELAEQSPQQDSLSNLEESSCQDNAIRTLCTPSKFAFPSPSKSNTLITEVETEKIEDRNFVVKITCKVGYGVAGDILRVVESLGFEIPHASIQQILPEELFWTIFIRVRKKAMMTEEKLKDSITSAAIRSGLTLQNL